MPLGAKPPQPLNWINAPGRVFMFRHGRSELTTTTLDEGQVSDLVEKMPKAAGRQVDHPVRRGESVDISYGGLAASD